MLPEHSYDALHAGEAYLVHLFEGTNLRAIHARRKTIKPKGIHLACYTYSMRGNISFSKNIFFFFLLSVVLNIR